MLFLSERMSNDLRILIRSLYLSTPSLANVFSSMEQVSVYEELLKVSKPCLTGTFYTGDMKVIAQLDTKDDVYV